MNVEQSGERDPEQDSPISDGPAESINGHPDIQAAAGRVEQARAQLRAAEACYQKLRKHAEQKVEQARKQTVGDVIDFAVSTAKKHPVPSLLTAGLLGYLLGRLFRR